MAMTRANSLGKGNIMESALFFEGDFTLDRLTEMTKKEGTSELTVHCKRRANWIENLEKNVHGGADLNPLEKERIIRWATYAKMDEDYGLDTFQNEVCTWIPE